MGRASNNPISDPLLRDTILGNKENGEDVRFRVEDLAEVAIIGAAGFLEEGHVPVVGTTGDSLLTSSIRQVITETVYGNANPTPATTAVWALTQNTIELGDTLSPGAEIAIGKRVRFRNSTSGLSLYANITGINGNLITIDENLNGNLSVIGPTGQLDNVLTVFTTGAVTITGDLTINGNITGEFNAIQTVNKATIDAAIGVSLTGDANRVYNELGEFVEVDPGSNLVDDFVPTTRDEAQIETFITTDFDTFTTQSDYVNSSATSFDLNRSIILTAPTTVIVGSLINSIFSNVNIAVGNRITIFNNNDNDLRFVRNITAINTTAGIITLDSGITEWEMLTNTDFNTSNNTVIFSKNNRTTVSGELRVTGRIDGEVDRTRALTNINTASGAIQPTASWSGTEVEYQRLLGLDLIDDNTNYDTY